MNIFNNLCFFKKLNWRSWKAEVLSPKFFERNFRRNSKRRITSMVEIEEKKLIFLNVFNENIAKLKSFPYNSLSKTSRETLSVKSLLKSG